MPHLIIALQKLEMGFFFFFTEQNVAFPLPHLLEAAY